MPDLNMSTKVMNADANNNTDAIADKLESCTLQEAELTSGDANNNKPAVAPAEATADQGTGDAAVDLSKRTSNLVSGSDLQTINENEDIENISNGDDNAFVEEEDNNKQDNATDDPEDAENADDEKELEVNLASIANLQQEMPTVDEDGCHPLEREWTWWFLNGDKPKNNDKNKGRDMGSEWNHGLLQVYKFTTVEDFWAVFNHMQSPAKLRLKNDYMVFQSGVRPEWEDKHNQGGGMWKIILPSKMRAEHLDRLWIEILLSMIGESYGDYGVYVCGAYLQRRQKEDRIQLWTTGVPKDMKDQQDTIICSIGETLKSALNLGKESLIHYLAHETSYGDNNGRAGGKHRSWTSRAKTNCLYTL